MREKDKLSEIIAPGKNETYNPTDIGLIGVSLDSMEHGKVFLDQGYIKSGCSEIGRLFMKVRPQEGVDYSLAIIYAYSFEGHMYSLDRPKIMVVKGEGDWLSDIPDAGGIRTSIMSHLPPNHSKEHNHERRPRIWKVDKLDCVVEIEINSGTAESLVLEANLPGNRSANSYRSTMQISHVGGRLS